MRTLLFTGALFFVSAAAANAQSLPANPLAARLCNGVWKLDKLQTRQGFQQQPAMLEFRLIVSPDGNMQQGMYPEGLVSSRWTTDALRNTLRVTDDAYTATHALRVVRLQRDELWLEESESGDRTLMIYRRVAP